MSDPVAVAGGDPAALHGGDEEELPLDERIVILTELRAGGDPDIDVSDVCGALGDAWLERYIQDPDEYALTTGLGYFTEAVEAAPGHPDRMRWWFWLGTGHGELANRRRSIDEYDRAIGWLERVLDELPADDADHDTVVVSLMELGWERFSILRHGDGQDVAVDRHHVDHLMSSLSSRTVSGSDPEAYHRAQMFLGLAQLERYEFTDHRPDLDNGIAALESATPHLALDTDQLPLARARLANAYQQRARLDDDRRSLDLAIATGAAAIDAIDADDPTWTLLHLYQAWGYQERWRQDADAADLDHAIDCWQVLLADDPDAYTAANCGDLLRQRAELTNDPADIAAAVPLLEFVAGSPPDHDDHWQPWYELGLAYQCQAAILDTPVQLDAALDCLDRALGLGAPDDDVLLLLHNVRLSIACDTLLPGAEATSTQPSRAAIRVRQVLADSGGALERASAAAPEHRAVLAGMLGIAEFGVTGHDAGTLDTARVRHRLELGRHLPDAPEEWLARMDAMIGMTLYSTDIARVGGSGEEGLAMVTLAANRPGLEKSTRAALRRILPLLLQGRSSRSGDLRGHRIAAATLSNPAPDPSGSDVAKTDPDYHLIGLIASALERATVADFDAFHALVRQAEEVLATLPQTLLGQRTVLPMVTVLRQLSALVEGRPVELADLALPSEHPSGSDPNLELMALVMTTGIRYTQAVFLGDLAGVRESAEHLDKLADFAQPGSVVRLGICHIGGQAWLEVARRDRADRSAARRATHWYEEATSSTGTEHPLWATFALNLAESLRLAGDPDRTRTRELGRSALRGHEWQVLLQAGTDYAIQAARAAAADAAKVAAWCLEDRAHDELLTVLDAGRGLVLRAASTSRGIAGELAAAGHEALAAEWQATAGRGRDRLTGGVLGGLAGDAEVPDDLRDRALRALGERGTATSLTGAVEEVRLADVQRALSAVDADALVYLVPSTADSPGTAVVVPVSGPIEPVPMPGLVVGADSAIASWAEASPGTRDAGAAAPPGSRPVGAPLDDLCQWAWTACVGRLVDHFQRRNLRRAARLVLVPMGMLGLVPWHAAYAPSSGERRYAIQELAFSYGVSAQIFCATASHPTRPIRSTLVVGNPGGDLAFAGIEADAVRRGFYPDGTYFGRPSDEATAPGTPGDVLDWLAVAPGPSMLHFACHGKVDPRFPADAHLVLAGGARLAARTLLEVSRLAALEIGRVFLAACTTNVIGEDYDEAFSLATGFLAAGAHTVFGSLWPVPDTDTSLLMYLVHHYLNVEGYVPLDALRRAQLWMLDPDRQPPTGMPADLVRFCQDPALARPVAWAGFTHLGR